ncbi:hypothetical protein EYC98_21315 [Halieaceae bacterium IMCC14734]|uniref:Uncharacterized protein n=1 Tax=Candidatus Litorirhabdus singularis TaxID=2518993 RepID=A0ABT3TM50_9GAMM|nr:hypothetical protein [Candidatus Litorirhabdus singularis]MCX2983407.1 hypothetical protein [Candidatus Litorirhabdus singularis]
MIKTLSLRIKQDITALSRLNTLPHVAVLFALVSGAQFTEAMYWISKGANMNQESLPNLGSILVFPLMLAILIRYNAKKDLVRARDQIGFSKLSLVCFILGSLLLSAGMALPALPYLASGGPLIIAGLLATLLNNRLKLQSQG